MTRKGIIFVRFVMKSSARRILSECLLLIQPLIPEKNKSFKYNDDKGGYNIHPLYNSNEAFTPNNRPNLYYPFYLLPQNKIDQHFYEIKLEKRPGSIEIFPPTSVKGGVQFVWRWGKAKAAEELNKEIIGYKTESGDFRIVQKMRHDAKLIRSILSDTAFATRRGTAEVEEVFGKKVFSFPKPLELIKKLAFAGAGTDDIILDIFAGSATSAHAIIQINAENNGNRKFIMVQLPEPTDVNSEAHKAGFKTIADIGKERIRRVIKKIKEELEKKTDLFSGDKPPQDLGFKVLKLQPSNFKLWNGEVAKDKETIERQLALFVEHINPKSSQEDILYEILLKSGFPLTTKIEKITLAEKTVFSIADGSMLICLEKELSPEVIKAMAEKKPVRVVCLDEGFKGNDQLKTNAVQIMKTKNITFRTV